MVSATLKLSEALKRIEWEIFYPGVTLEAVQRQRKGETSSKSYTCERLFYDHRNAAVVIEDEGLFLEDYDDGVKEYLGKPVQGSAEELLGEAALESYTLDQLKEELDQESQNLEEFEQHMTM